MELTGILPALTTPFAADGSVSLPDLRHNLERYAKTGVGGFVVLGSTGESVMLSAAEQQQVLAAARGYAAPGLPMLAGTGAESTAATIENTKRAAALGYEAALVKTPYYYRPSYKPDALIAHYRAVADASPIPIFLYSIPLFTGITLEAPEVAVLAQHPNIIGIKDSSGSVQRAAEMLAAVPRQFQYVTGSAAVIYPTLALGARAAILALADVLPEKCVELCELTASGKHDEARGLQLRLAVASRRIVSECSIPGVKYLMDVRGYRGGAPRSPLQPPSESQRTALAAALEEFEPLVARA
jgi:4-hydroxy-2-oxoglutarate aldolase